MTNGRSNPAVLVVDDEPGIRAACVRIIREAGWLAAEASSGEQAVERLSKERFDVVLTDVMMDEMDGTEVARHARARSPEVSVILMTSYPTLETAVQALRNGASDYILKPFNGDAVLHAVRRCWDLRKLAEELDEEKGLRRELLAAYEELKRYEKIKSDFTARVSHELRTPMTSILTSLELLAGQELTPDTGRLVAILQASFGKLKGSVDDLLAFSDLENGRLRCRRRDTRLAPLLKGIIDHFAPLAAERRLKVRLDAPDGQDLAWADPDLLALALKHLLANAVLHNVADGSIDLSVSRSDAETVIRITGTSRGLPVEELPRIFDSFYQVGDILTREVGGLGLGLAIVRQAIRLHGGTVAASILPDRRVQFVIALPNPSV